MISRGCQQPLEKRTSSLLLFLKCIRPLLVDRRPSCLLFFSAIRSWYITRVVDTVSLGADFEPQVYSPAQLSPITSEACLNISQKSVSVMPSALILVADGSEEIEFVTVYDGKPTQLHN